MIASAVASLIAQHTHFLFPVLTYACIFSMQLNLQPRATLCAKRASKGCRLSQKLLVQTLFGGRRLTRTGEQQRYPLTLRSSPRGGAITWINRWMAAGEKIKSTVPLYQRDFHESWGISPCDLCECRHVTWAAEQCAVICTKKVLVLLKHQRQEQAQASTVKLSNTSPVYPAAHSSHAALHQDSKCNFTSMALNF